MTILFYIWFGGFISSLMSGMTGSVDEDDIGVVDMIVGAMAWPFVLTVMILTSKESD